MPDIRLTALAATLLLSLPAAAAELTAKPVATPVPAERKICRTETRTGSNMPRRICHTRAEWDVLAGQSAEATARALDRRPATGGGAGGGM
jgi:hypothetical protein